MVNEEDLAGVLARLDEPEAQFWKAVNPGDQIAGILVSVGKRTTKVGTSPAITLDTPTGKFIVLCGTTVLHRELIDDRDQQPGDQVAIRYTGVSDKGAKLYRVACEPERPRKAQDQATTAEPWGYDDDGAPLPTEPPDNPPF
jgi:hypothetical protein